jgi:hypothetical protein
MGSKDKRTKETKKPKKVVPKPVPQPPLARTDVEGGSKEQPR